MRFGVREICEVVLRAKTTMTLGSKKFYKNEPVLYFDTLKTSTVEGAATTVYATGGRGNTRLIAWEGERTLTFTMEDALISPESFSILSGAGLISATKDKPAYVHISDRYVASGPNTIPLPQEACWNKYTQDDEYYEGSCDIFVMTLDDNGRINAEPCIPAAVSADHKTVTCYGHNGGIKKDDVVLVDYYVKKTTNTQTIEITADKFGGNYYLEASTLFREENTGVDMPAEFVIPNCKVQSNFTFTMAATGDPSTFTFTMDAFPDYTKFDKTHKVLAAIQIITDDVDAAEETRGVCTPYETYDYETGTISYGNMAVKDLYHDDVKAEIDATDKTKWNITGTFNSLTKWDGLPHSSWQEDIDEETGSAFYAVQIPESNRGKKLTISVGGQQKTSGTIGDQELFWVFNVTDKPTIEIKIDDEVFATLDFSKITILPKEGE